MKMQRESEDIRPVHLVGSIPLSSAGEVFAAVADTVGDYVHSVPDGETGVLRHWLIWQKAVFERRGQFESTVVPSDYRDTKLEYRPKPGIAAEQIEFDHLGYPHPYKNCC